MPSLPFQTIQTNPQKARTIRRKVEWQAILSEYATSNLSQKAFCESHQLSMSSFYQWKKKLSKALSGENDFVDISTQIQPSSLSSTPSSYQIELELGFGITLKVRRG